jgi:hypothetical protein
MAAAAGALLSAVAGELDDVLVEIEQLVDDMLCDLDPDEPPEGLPRELVLAWRSAMKALERIAAIVAKAGATADAGAQALGELSTSNSWGSAPACVDRISAARQQRAGHE